MKCPSCGTLVDRDYMVVGNTLYRPNGSPIQAGHGLLGLLAKLLEGPVHINHYRNYYVWTHRLRELIALHELPFLINPRGGYYILTRTDYVKNNGHAEHTTDVRS